MDLTEVVVNRDKDVTLSSEVPSNTKYKPCLLGIDEAGRGPVLGPMVYGTAYCAISQKENMTKIGCQDSKTLTETQRESLFEKLHTSGYVGWIVTVLSPVTISNSMLRRSKYNLNSMSHDTAIGLIQKALNNGVNVKEVYVDTVGDPGKYQSKLEGLFPGISITVAKKADSTYSIVSAASICAKVARDAVVSKWEFCEAVTIDANVWGSGYPNDPKTKTFLTENFDPIFGFPQLCRFSWSTAEKIMTDKGIRVDWEDFDDEEGVKPKKVPKIDTFFGAVKSTPAAKLFQPRFFRERNLKHVTNF